MQCKIPSAAAAAAAAATKCPETYSCRDLRNNNNLVPSLPILAIGGHDPSTSERGDIHHPSIHISPPIESSSTVGTGPGPPSGWILVRWFASFLSHLLPSGYPFWFLSKTEHAGLELPRFPPFREHTKRLFWSGTTRTPRRGGSFLFRAVPPVHDNGRARSIAVSLVCLPADNNNKHPRRRHLCGG